MPVSPVGSKAVFARNIDAHSGLVTNLVERSTWGGSFQYMDVSVQGYGSSPFGPMIAAIVEAGALIVSVT